MVVAPTDARLDAFHGTASLPFVVGKNGKVGVKFVDDRGIESLEIMNLED
jgi:adenine-specific DNA-methyltransferase